METENQQGKETEQQNEIAPDTATEKPVPDDELAQEFSNMRRTLQRMGRRRDAWTN